MTAPPEGTSATGAPVPALAGAMLRALRPHQWAKNALVLVPLLGAHLAGDLTRLRGALLGLAAFCLTASAVYLTNDLADLAADRLHPRKRMRPLASGALPAGVARGMVPVLLAGAVGLALLLPPSFGLILGVYWLATIAYSLGLKRRPVLDVLVLAGLYTARLYAGGAAARVPVSEWLATFSMFLFLSLAFLKRAVELAGAQSQGRGYRVEDREPVFAMGIASGYLSVLVLALYVSAQDTARLYAHPERLWLLCPLFLYWVSRVWLLARRGELDDDPVIFALRDPASWSVAALCALVVWLGR
ncbi:MAG: UbiA family prenyltransferase [Deltaproteobacteria bacterium]|nr:UbiA family prenyltransferase [Deltaproteobacteria bacterium]